MTLTKQHKKKLSFVGDGAVGSSYAFCTCYSRNRTRTWYHRNPSII